jgi:SAM-dependent methyltransferase
MHNWFEHWFDSPYYHLLYQHRNNDEAAAFVEKLVDTFQWGAQTTLLDVACGKGRHARAFAAHGMDVCGIDLSVNSIEAASAHAHDHLQFYVHDMRRVFRVNYFDVVCNLFTSFGYFQSERDHQLAADAMATAIHKHGMVIIDFVNKAFGQAQIQERQFEETRHEDIKFTVRREFTATHFLKHITVSDKGKEWQFEERLRVFGLDEMQQVFRHSGLHQIKLFGNYQLDEYHEQTSPRMILVFTK